MLVIKLAKTFLFNFISLRHRIKLFRAFGRPDDGRSITVISIFSVLFCFIFILFAFFFFSLFLSFYFERLILSYTHGQCFCFVMLFFICIWIISEWTNEIMVVIYSLEKLNSSQPTSVYKWQKNFTVNFRLGWTRNSNIG